MLKVPPQSLLQFAPTDFNLLDDDHPPPSWCGDWVSRRWVEVAADAAQQNSKRVQ